MLAKPVRAMEAEPIIDPELNIESLMREFLKLRALKDAARTQHEAALAAATAETLRLTQAARLQVGECNRVKAALRAALEEKAQQRLDHYHPPLPPYHISPVSPL